jgi:hypothetical protein
LPLVEAGPGEEGADLLPAEKVAELGGGVGRGSEGLVEAVHIEQDLGLRGLGEPALDLALQLSPGLVMARELGAIREQRPALCPVQAIGLFREGPELPDLPQLQIHLPRALGELALLAQGLPVQPGHDADLGGAEGDAPGSFLAVGQGALVIALRLQLGGHRWCPVGDVKQVQVRAGPFLGRRGAIEDRLSARKLVQGRGRHQLARTGGAAADHEGSKGGNR